MIFLLWNLSIRARAVLKFTPTNLVLDAIRTRKGLRWGIPAMALGVAYFYAASICTVLISHGAPSWLNGLVLLFVWNGFKFLWIGPVSLAKLIRVRIREAHSHTHDGMQEKAAGRP